MATLGFNDLKDIQLPTLWDTAYLKKIELADGTTFDLVVADVRAGLSQLNQDLLQMPHYSGLISVTEDVTVDDVIGFTGGVEDATEYGQPIPRRASRTGHMLPIFPKDRALGWTAMFLRNTNQAQIDTDVRAAFIDIEDDYQRRVLQQFFRKEGVKVGATANASVPFVDAAATDTTYFPPPNRVGKSFTTSHTHFLRHATLDQASLELAVATLAEHNHKQPFDIIGAEADQATWTSTASFPKYKLPEWSGIVYRTAVDRAAIEDVAEFFGYIETAYGIARLWLSPRVPTGYYGVYKSYGVGDARNPLRLRINPRLGWGWKLVDGQWVNQPLNMAVLYSEYGLGTGEDRTNGVAVKIAGAGNYDTPTIA